MSPLSWYRRASGLLVPTLGVTNKVGRWGMCGPTDCCPSIPPSCNVFADCQNSQPTPADALVAVLGVLDDECDDCSFFNDSHTVPEASAPWGWGFITAVSPDCSETNRNIISAAISVIFNCVWDGADWDCRMTASFIMFWNTSGDPEDTTNREEHNFIHDNDIGDFFVASGNYPMTWAASGCRTNEVPTEECDPNVLLCDFSGASVNVTLGVP